MAIEHFDTVVVGSGFGGSVMADTLAKGGQRVCLLERGRPYPPGSFARSPREMRENLWDPAAGLHGMFNLWSFKGVEAVVSSGLGGGSLIYANVLIRKDERWFVKDQPIGGGYENWPIDRADLDPHYDRVERMMGANPYPFLDTTPKTQAMKHAAGELGLEWQLPNLAVTFAGADGVPRAGVPMAQTDSYPNIHGQVKRLTCTLCGECDIGCNSGAKNTLDHNYLSSAAHHGADIRTRAEVRRIRARQGGGYEVDYVSYTAEDEGHPTTVGSRPHTTVTSDRLVMGAGTLGTTYLLLRNRAGFPAIGPALGTRFSGNGDLLTMAMRAHRDGQPISLRGSYGPVITSTLRVPDEVDGGSGRGYYVQDAGFPEFVEWILETAATPSSLRRISGFAWRTLKARIRRHPDSDISAEFTAVLGDALLSTTSMPLLGMGRDVPDGRLKLRHGYLDLDWTTKTSIEFFERMRSTMRGIAGSLGADYRDNPLWRLRRRVITVHPLGGAPMGRHVDEGVVDTYGEAFGHPGLFVVDGSALPGPVGPNPSLTIAAFADRAARRILESTERVAPASRPAGVTSATMSQPESPEEPTEPDAAEISSVRFTEEMKGHVTLEDVGFEDGARRGKGSGTSLRFKLTITVPDVVNFVDDPEREGSAEGYVFCDALGGKMPVERGVFNLFVDTEDPETTRMLYRLWFRDSVGNPLTLTGFKTIKDDPGLDVWTDTSTLYVKLLAGHVEPDGDGAATVAGAGILRIEVVDFLQQLTTFRTSGPDDVASLATFGKLFLGELWTAYGGRAGKDPE